LQTRGQQAEEALALARETLARFREQGPTDEELRRAQDNIARGFGLRLDSNRKLIGYVSMMGYYNLPTDWLERYPQAVRAVTGQQVQDAFVRRIDPDRLVTVRVGGDGDR
jgi:zinc protease